MKKLISIGLSQVKFYTPETCDIERQKFVKWEILCLCLKDFYPVISQEQLIVTSVVLVLWTWTYILVELCSYKSMFAFKFIINYSNLRKGGMKYMLIHMIVAINSKYEWQIISSRLSFYAKE